MFLLRPVVVVRAALVALVWAAWLLWAPLRVKAESVLVATVYSAIEFTWYTLSVEEADGSVRFAPFARNRRKGFTTFAQWWANVVYAPVLLHGYWRLVPPSAWLRVLCFPLNVWALEIVQGYGLAFVYGGKNPAWHYSDRWALFDGHITLSHWNLWLLLGAAVHFFAAPWMEERAMA